MKTLWTLSFFVFLTVEVASAVLVPVIVETNPPLPGMVSGDYEWQPTADNSPLAFTITGLPSGLKVSASGLVTGRPLKAGSVEIRVSARNSAGTGPVKKFTLAVAGLPDGIVGLHSALIARQEAVNQQLGGLVTLNITSTGSFTGSVRHSTTAQPLSGKVNAALDGSVGLQVAVSRPGTKSTMLLTLNFDGATNSLNGMLLWGSDVAGVSGRRHTFSGTAAGDFSGICNAAIALPGGAEADASQPQGHAWQQLKITSAGAVTGSGMTADGTAFTFAGSLWPDGSVPQFALLDAGRGSVTGLPRILPAAQPQDRRASGWMERIKNGPANAADRTYKEGIALWRGDVDGSMWIKPAAGQPLLPGFATPSAYARLLFTRGDVESAAQFESLDQICCLQTGGMAVFDPKSLGNPCLVRATITASSGLFTGGFTLTDKVANKTVTRPVRASGILIGHLARGVGAFTLAGVQTGSSVLAGRMELEKFSGGPDVPHPLFGLNFAPYLDGQSPGKHSQISRNQIESMMQLLKGRTQWVRTFRMTDGSERAGEVARQLGLQTALGAWLGKETTAADLQANQANIQQLIAAANRGEADLLIVGSEVLLRRDLSAAKLAQYLQQVRAAVPHGLPVTTADVYDRLIDPAHAEVLGACDLLLPNIYPFWEKYPIDEALPALHQAYHNTKLAAGAKPVWISETGWPSAGGANGAAVPSAANAALYFQRAISWTRHHSIPCFYFEAFDQGWKTAEGTVGSNWGVWTRNGNLKDGMQNILQSSVSPADWNNVPGGAGTPVISFTSIPPLGSKDKYVSGNAQHVAPADVLVSLYIKVGGLWWGPKPFSRFPFTALRTNGNWKIQFNTGGSDASATELAVFLLPLNSIPPQVEGWPALPGALTTESLAHTIVPR